MQDNVSIIVALIVIFCILSIIIWAGLLYIETCIVYLRLRRQPPRDEEEEQEDPAVREEEARRYVLFFRAACVCVANWCVCVKECGLRNSRGRVIAVIDRHSVLSVYLLARGK